MLTTTIFRPILQIMSKGKRRRKNNVDQISFDFANKGERYSWTYFIFIRNHQQVIGIPVARRS